MKIRKGLLELFFAEKKTLNQLDYIFCSDDYLLKINQTYLKHDTYTDVITFDLKENEGVKGEIYISIDRVKENASLLQVNFKDELGRVMLHGALHLCGYKDKKKSEITVMREKEDYYLRLLHAI